MFNYQVLWKNRGTSDAQVSRDIRVLRNKHAFLWSAGIVMLAIISLIWLLLPVMAPLAASVVPLLYLVSLFVAKPIIERKTV